MDSWIQQANYGNPTRQWVVGFNIGAKGFIGTGVQPSNGIIQNEFWEYTPSGNFSHVPLDTDDDNTCTTDGCNTLTGVFHNLINSDDNNVCTIDGCDSITGIFHNPINIDDDNACTTDDCDSVTGIFHTPVNVDDNNICTTDACDPFSNNWMQKATYPSFQRYAGVGFSIGNKGYIGTGKNNNVPLSDFWEYDPVTDFWTQKADFSGGARYDAVGFSIGQKGYIGTGYDGTLKNDFWEYDPIPNAWIQIIAFPGAPRFRAVGFSIANKGYIGTGTTSSGLTNDFWEYDPFGNWTQKSNFGGTARLAAVGFNIGTKGYIGTGADSVSQTKDFWEYNPVTNSWIQKADFGGAAKYYGVGFSIGTKGFIGNGWSGGLLTNDFWEYNPNTDFWIEKANAGSPAWFNVGFSIGSKGYLGSGINLNGYENVFLEYTPAGNITHLPVNTDDNNVCTIDGCDSLTGIFHNSINTDDDNVCTEDGCDSVTGIFHNPLNVDDNNACTTDGCDSITGIFHTSLNPDATVNNSSPVCVGRLLNFTSSGGVSYSWSGPNGFNSLLQNTYLFNVALNQAGIYSVTVTGANGCTSSATTTVTVNPSPIVTVSNSGPVCVGSSLFYSSGGGTSYSWSGPNGFNSLLQFTYLFNVALNQAGTYAVTVTDANGCTASATTTVIVNPLPGATANNNSPICSGGTLNLTSSGGTSYSWTGADGFISTLQNPVLSNITSGQTGIYTVTVTDANGCTASATTTVNIAITNDNNICTTDGCDTSTGIFHIPVNVDDNNACTIDGCNTLNGIFHNPIILSSEIFATICATSNYTLPWNVIVSSEGDYSFTYTSLNGCDSIVTVHLTSHLLPDPTVSANGPTILCNGESVTLTVIESATSYLWNTGATTQSITINTPGDYFVIVMNEYNCTATSPIISVMTQDCPVTLHLRIFIEGFYLGNKKMTPTIDPVNFPLISDYIKVELHNPISPYARDYYLTGMINTDGWGNFIFPSGVYGNSYYIVVKHRNSIGTWSKNPVIFNQPVVEFDFTE